MRLETYLQSRRISYAKFAERIGVANASVVMRYAKGRVPRSQQVMAKIIAATDGAVQPNDFFADAAD